MGGLRFVFSSFPFSSGWIVMNSVDPLGRRVSAVRSLVAAEERGGL